jgi:hypothetical protein
MSGEYKLLDSAEDLCGYILELYEASLMRVKRNELVLKELSRNKVGNGAGEGGGVPPQSDDVATVLQYDDVDLLTYMSTHMQKATVLEPMAHSHKGGAASAREEDVSEVDGYHICHSFSWICNRMKQHLKQTVSTGA